MRIARLALTLSVGLILIIAVSANAIEWYVVKHKSGAATVVDYKPGLDWTIVSGPYMTKDEAARVGGVDPAKVTMKPSRTK